MGFFMQGTTLGGENAVNTAQQVLQQTPHEVAPINVLDLAIKGGLVMLPLAILSVITVYIIVERWMIIKKATKNDANFLNNIKDYVHNGKIDSARALCKSTDTPVARIIEKGVSRIGQPNGEIAAAIENAASLEVHEMEKNVSFLATVAGAAPMLGLIGTVLGMIRTFYNIANSPDGIQMISLSEGVYEAMVATVAGLTVGIVAFIGYNVLVSRVQKVVYLLEMKSVEFMDMLNTPSH